MALFLRILQAQVGQENKVWNKVAVGNFIYFWDALHFILYPAHHYMIGARFFFCFIGKYQIINHVIKLRTSGKRSVNKLPGTNVISVLTNCDHKIFTLKFMFGYTFIARYLPGENILVKHIHFLFIISKKGPKYPIYSKKRRKCRVHFMDKYQGIIVVIFLLKCPI